MHSCSPLHKFSTSHTPTHIHTQLHLDSAVAGARGQGQLRVWADWIQGQCGVPLQTVLWGQETQGHSRLLVSAHPLMWDVMWLMFNSILVMWLRRSHFWRWMENGMESCTQLIQTESVKIVFFSNLWLSLILNTSSERPISKLSENQLLLLLARTVMYRHCTTPPLRIRRCSLIRLPRPLFVKRSSDWAIRRRRNHDVYGVMWPSPSLGRTSRLPLMLNTLWAPCTLVVLCYLYCHVLVL